jgi:hypothetical protein
VRTLDREGSLAVYIGRAGCAEPDRDILIFRPTNANGEESVDVYIGTQVLEPILAQRSTDGTATFEAYGDHHRKLVAPDEIAVICVHLSQSMTEPCGFIDVQHNEDANEQLKQTSNMATQAWCSTMASNPAFHLLDSDELKEFLEGYESFDDCFAIIRAGIDDYQRRLNTERVLRIIQQIDTLKIDAKTQELEKLRRRASHYHYRMLADNIDREINTVKNRSACMEKYKFLLCVRLLTCLGENDSLLDPLVWHPGDAMPDIPVVPVQGAPTGPTFEIPREICCHISSEIMDDPVATVDGFTYERKNIERWFRTNETSPLINLVLSSLDHRLTCRRRNRLLLSSAEPISHRSTRPWAETPT